MSSFRVRYQTIEIENTDIHLKTLRDKQEFYDKDNIAMNHGICSASWSYFGVVWASSRVLAGLMLHEDIENKRILEVGCGMALSSHVLNNRLADITATDYHPEVEAFLDYNAELNKTEKIPFKMADWKNRENILGNFDLIIGSDLLYEGDQVDCLSDFIYIHSKKRCEVILVDPGRSYHGRFSKKMVSLGYVHSYTKAIDPDNADEAFQGQVLRYNKT